MYMKKGMKIQIAFWVAIFLFVYNIFFGGSVIVDMYAPSIQEQEIPEIVYNKDALSEITAGYEGEPKLVKSDDKVFYIPPEYCGGHLLKNFRIIGINNSEATEVKNANGDITDYTGAVVLYGFQTTYKADYGAEYDFDYEPYDYDVEYEMVDSYFESPFLETKSTIKENSEETTDFALSGGEATFTENEKAVDDSEFRVATIVMEHTIGKDECAVLYCDPNSAKVSDLGAGKFNLVTNLNESALTVCYNDKLFVYGFDEKNKTYANDERYYYKLQDLFDSITFLNIMNSLEYADVGYSISGRIEPEESEKGWANTWIEKMEKYKEFEYEGRDDVYKYMSNIEGDTISESAISNYFGISMPNFVQESMKNAYEEYKKTTSGCLSYKENSTIELADGDWQFVKKANDGNKTWSLKKDINICLNETSWNIIYPHTYKETVKASIYLDITPKYELKKEYDYTIMDLLLTKYDIKDDENNHYSAIMQMMVTPKEASEEETEPEAIEDFEKYAEEIGKVRGRVTVYGRDEISKLPSTEETDDEPEEELENELEDMEEEELEALALEEELEKQISGNYITFNIKLDQVQGVVDVSDEESFEIKKITGGAELNAYFEELKKKYKQEYEDNVEKFNSDKEAGNVTPKDFNTADMEKIKEKFEEIKNICVEIEETENKIAELTAEKDAIEISSKEEELKSSIKEIEEKTGYNADKINEMLQNAIKFKSINKADFIWKYKSIFGSEDELIKSVASLFDESGQISQEKYNNYKQGLNNLVVKVKSVQAIYLGNNKKKAYCNELTEEIIICLNYLEYKCYIESSGIDEKTKSLDDAYLQYENISEQIEYLNSQLEQFKAQRDSLKEEFNKDYSERYSIKLKWNGENLDGDGLIKFYKEYDEIISKLSEYEEKYNAFLPNAGYENSADEFINEAKKINADDALINIFDVINFTLSQERGAELFGEKYTSYLFLSDNKGAFYENAENVRNAFKLLVKRTEEKEEIPENTGEIIINEYISKKYANISDNLLAKKSYDVFLADCDEIYNAIMSKYENIYDENGNIKDIGTENICDITLEDVRKNAEIYFCNERNIFILYDYDSSGEITGTHTLSNGCLPSTSIIIEQATESTTEETYKDSNELIYASFDGLNEYTQKINKGFEDMSEMANLYLDKEGALSASGKGGTSLDITSDYYAYTKGVEYGKNLAKYLEQSNKYYNALKTYEQEMSLLEKGKLAVERCDDIYYKWEKDEKITEADEINVLILEAKAVGTTDTEKFIREYEKKEWLIEEDLKLTNDLAINVEVAVEKIKTLYQDVKWNTALVKEGDIASNVTEEPYEFYQMEANYCIASSSDEAFLVPIGVQIYNTLSARELNRKIADEIKEAGIFEINNVAYGSVGDYKGGKDKYDIVLFSGSDKWFSIFMKQGELDESGKPTYDVNNIYGEKGTFSIEENNEADANAINSADAHFLEYDHTQITGSTQFYTTTTENGYAPYKIDLNNKIITPDDNAEGIEGAYYKSWAASNGYVVLIGYTEDDLYMEGDGGEEISSTATEDITEETTAERQKREVNDLDMYNAHLYVLKYQVREPEVPISSEETNINLGEGSLQDELVQLEGEYGELATPVVNFFIMLKYAVFAVVYAIAMIYCIYLGTKYAKAKDEEEKIKAKEHIKWFIIAFIGTHMLIVFISLGTKQLEQWQESVTVITTEAGEK